MPGLLQHAYAKLRAELKEKLKVDIGELSSDQMNMMTTASLSEIQEMVASQVREKAKLGNDASGAERLPFVTQRDNALDSFTQITREMERFHKEIGKDLDSDEARRVALTEIARFENEMRQLANEMETREIGWSLGQTSLPSLAIATFRRSCFINEEVGTSFFKLCQYLIKHQDPEDRVIDVNP